MAQKAETPGEQLVDNLDQLRTTLNSLSERLNSSGVERTNGLRQIMGRDCDFYRKSLDLLLTKDYKDLRDLCKTAHGLFQLVEGPNED